MKWKVGGEGQRRRLQSVQFSSVQFISSEPTKPKVTILFFMYGVLKSHKMYTIALITFQRMEDESYVKQILKYKPKGRRDLERPLGGSSILRPSTLI
jgi:hypothetical protein